MAHPAKHASGQAALDFLHAQHQRVRRLFAEFDALRTLEDADIRKTELVDDICQALTLHTMLEEEIFYPLLRAAIGNDELMDEADVEHAGALDLVSQLEAMYPGDEHFEATVSVLAEEVLHHIDKEENEMFAAARRSGIDMAALAARLAARHDALEQDPTAPPASGATDAMPLHDGTRRVPRAPN